MNLKNIVKSLTDYFRSINYETPEFLEISKRDVLTRLGIDQEDHQFIATPLQHADVMKRLNMKAGDRNSQNCFGFYENPNGLTSAHLSYTKETYHPLLPKTDIWSFVLCDDLDRAREGNPLLAGFSATQDMGADVLKVLKLYCPVKNDDGTISPPLDTWAITQENVDFTLRYMTRCAEHLYAGKTLTPLVYLEQTLKETDLCSQRALLSDRVLKR